MITIASLFRLNYQLDLVISFLTKEKGGIHAINRSIMDAFGYFRVTGLLQKISAGI